MTFKLRESTASQEIPLGYFLDSTNGDSEETGLTIANTDIKLWKTGATTLANKNSGGATHMSNGIYYAVLDATDSNTLGPMVVFVHISGALSMKLECEVLPANGYDSLVLGTDILQVEPHSKSHCATAGTIFVGTQSSGSYSDTCVDDTNHWKITNVGGAVDAQLEFSIGTKRTPTYMECILQTVSGTGGDMDFYAYNYMTSAWDKLNYNTASTPGLSGRTYGVALLSDHKDPDYAGAGTVKIRCVSDDHGPGENMEIDLCKITSVDSTSVFGGAQLLSQGKDDVNAECDTAVATLNNISTSDVNDQVVDVIRTDTNAEPTQGAPPATASLQEKIDYIYMILRNKGKVDTNYHTVYADNDTTEVMKAAVSEVSSVFTKDKFGAGT